MQRNLSIEHERHKRSIPQPPLSFVRRIISGLRIFPKSHDFFGYFQRSGENIVDGTRLLCKMIAHKEERSKLVVQLKDYEHVGDHITHDVIDLLHKTFLTPFDRSDIYTLIVKMDDILDITYYVGNRLTRYNLSELPDEMAQLAEIVCKSSEEIAKAVVDLKNLKNSQKILGYCIEVNRLENEADEKMNMVIEGLFTNGWDPFEVIKIKELLENLETAADKCEDVANIIEGIILRNA